MQFNTPTKKKTVTKNHEGAKAYSMSKELELYSAVVTCMVGNNFYESGDDRINRIRNLIKECKPEFVAKLAVYTRHSMNLRSIPLVLVVELAKIHNGDDLISRTVNKVVSRADEITELLAYYGQANKRKDTKKLNKLSKQIQKGLTMAFNNFNEYTFAKYNRGGEVSLKDALFLVHPKAKDEKQQLLFDKITKGTLETPDTWEVVISEVGQKEYADDKEKVEAKRAVWERLIDENKLGYMALLRNLRNIIEIEVRKVFIQKVCSTLSNEQNVLYSKQLPFRFYSAYSQLQDMNSTRVAMVLDALEEAAIHSAGNIEGFDYDTSVLIASDVSGSMFTSISEKSIIQQYDIGLMLSMLLRHRCRSVITGIFGNTFKIKNFPKSSILSNVSALKSIAGEVGYSTNGYLVIQRLIDDKKIMDKVMIFTDCQLWNSHGGSDSMSSLWANYKKMAPNAKLYLFDLKGYGNTPLSTNDSDVYFISGWSDRIFGILNSFETGGNAVKEIEKIEI